MARKPKLDCVTDEILRGCIVKGQFQVLGFVDMPERITLGAAQHRKWLPSQVLKAKFGESIISVIRLVGWGSAEREGRGQKEEIGTGISELTVTEMRHVRELR
jgi:hypothetical protein